MRFMHGFNFELFGLAFNRYQGGEKRGRLMLGSLTSSGTGHWPFSLFELCFLTGGMKAFHITVLGCTFGYMTQHDIDADGMLQGPDFTKWYSLFSCINHYQQTLEEIITNANDS